MLVIRPRATGKARAICIHVRATPALQGFYMRCRPPSDTVGAARIPVPRLSMTRFHSPLRLTSRRFAALALALASAGVAAGEPLYHLTVLEVPDATAVTAKDINDAGQVVGTWSDQDFVRHAVLWDGEGWRELALPPGVEVNGIAYAINDSGRIVGTSDDFVNPTAGLLWDAGNPGSYTLIGAETGVHVSPEDINDAGVVVGGFGVPSRAFA